IEHNLDVIKCADYIVDMGPEGGNGGGEVIANGTPEQVAAVGPSHTGTYLAKLVDADHDSDPEPIARPKRRASRAKAAAKQADRKPASAKPKAAKKSTAAKKSKAAAASS
ncbi:MAG: excinuclease ABC subunit A, partial [Thermoleophilia bacterium]|nr:excinuclease ABC subunit A [Thermoleophilia bacterium]